MAVLRSITQIVSSLKTAFRDSEYQDAENELKAREDFLRTQYDVVESERSNLSLQLIHLEDSQRRLTRESEIKDDKLNDLARELSIMTEKDEKSIKRYEKLLIDVTEIELQKEKLLRKIDRDKSSFVEKETVLKDERDSLREKLEAFRELAEKVREIERENEVFRKEKNEVELLKRKVEGLEVKNSRLKEEMLGLRELERENEEKIIREKEVLQQGKCEAEKKFEVIRRKYEYLTAQKTKSGYHLEGCKKLLREIAKKSDEQLGGLRRVCNDMEKGNGGEWEEKEKHEEDKISKYKKLEEQVFKIEKDVANFLLAGENKLMDTQIGKVLDSFVKAIDAEEGGVTRNAPTHHYEGNVKEGGSVASHIKEPTICLETDMIVEAVRTSQPFNTEVPMENETISNKRDATSQYIVLSDSDNDGENPIAANELKRQRVSSHRKNERSKLGETSDDSLNSSCKFKKLRDLHLPHDGSNHKPLIAASGSRSDDNSVIPQKQMVASLRQCDEVLGQKVKAMWDGDNSQDNDVSVQADCSPEVRKLISNFRSKRLR